jgi:predicted phage replisome organizer
MADKSGRYYWLKLKRDFFKRHDIRIVEEMTNGKEYILFYLKLLCESVDHDGSLRFSDEVPYNDEMLSVITNTNIDIVRSAVKVFTELRMMEVLDDGTLYLREVETMIGSASASENALRQARYRERKKEDVTLPLLEHNTDVTKSNESKSKSKRQSKRTRTTVNPVW